MTRRCLPPAALLILSGLLATLPAGAQHMHHHPDSTGEHASHDVIPSIGASW